jgi:hypothetical protein
MIPRFGLMVSFNPANLLSSMQLTMGWSLLGFHRSHSLFFITQLLYSFRRVSFELLQHGMLLSPVVGKHFETMAEQHFLLEIVFRLVLVSTPLSVPLFCTGTIFLCLWASLRLATGLEEDDGPSSFAFLGHAHRSCVGELYREGSMSITTVGEEIDHPPGLSGGLAPGAVVLNSGLGSLEVDATGEEFTLVVQEGPGSASLAKSRFPWSDFPRKCPPNGKAPRVSSESKACKLLLLLLLDFDVEGTGPKVTLGGPGLLCIIPEFFTNFALFVDTPVLLLEVWLAFLGFFSNSKSRCVFVMIVSCQMFQK